MHETFELRGRQMIGLTGATLDALRLTVLRDGGLAGATRLQDAGYAGGRALYDAFRDWLTTQTDTDPRELPTPQFGEHLSEFFRQAGWGSVRLGSLGDAVATVDSADWRESETPQPSDHPGCHLTTGMLAAFFTAAGDASIAALEVECRAKGDARCRFLIGAGPLLTHVFEQVERGRDYEGALVGE